MTLNSEQLAAFAAHADFLNKIRRLASEVPVIAANKAILIVFLTTLYPGAKPDLCTLDNFINVDERFELINIYIAQYRDTTHYPNASPFVAFLNSDIILDLPTKTKIQKTTNLR